MEKMILGALWLTAFTFPYVERCVLLRKITNANMQMSRIGQ
jgi:hypothetical protein